MTLRIAVQTDNIEGLDVIRDRLGDSGNVRDSVTPVLRRASRLGAEAARIHAPRGRTGRLRDAIADDAIVFRIRGDTVSARFGVQPVMNPGRGDRFYPVAVEQGTGIYGRLGRVITAKRAPMMSFPGGGKPWPIQHGRTGNIVKFSVRGQRSQPFMAMAYDEARLYVESHLDEIFNRLVE